MLAKLRQILYRQQPKSADLLMGIVSILLATSAFATRNINTDSPVIIAIEKVAPLLVWILLLLFYGVNIIVATLANRSLGILIGSGFGTFVWGAICGTLLFHLPLEPLLLLNISIYVVFFTFSAWSFINSQEVHRLTKKYGKNYHRVVEEDMLREIIDLRTRVLQATTINDEHELERQERHVE